MTVVSNRQEVEDGEAWRHGKAQIPQLLMKVQKNEKIVERVESRPECVG
jgi:hypothetical protein